MFKFGFGKKKTAPNANAVDKNDLMISIDANIDTTSDTSTESLIRKIGKSRQEILDICLGDGEVESCREDIEGAILGKEWRIYAPLEQQGETPEDDLNRLYVMVQKHLETFANLAILAKFNGYAVAEYVYKQEPDGFITLAKVLDKDGELDKYEPKRNGTVVYCSINGEKVFDENYQRTKLLLLTNKATPARPMGEMSIVRTYPYVTLRNIVTPYTGQFVKRYAQPYVVGKSGGFGDKQSFASTLLGFINGGATGIGRDDEISVHQLNGNGEAFGHIKKMADAEIQKQLVGRVKTSELSNGSRSAQETDDQTRKDRIKKYLKLMQNAIQHAIDAVLLVNQAYGKPIHAPQGLIFEYAEQAKVDMERAERDKLYFDMGVVSPTESYMTDIVGFEKGHIIMNATPKPKGEQFSNQTFYFSAQKPDDEHLPPNDFTADKVDKILALLDDSKSYDDFQDKLASLEFDNKTLIDDLAKQMISAYVKGLAGTTNQQGENQL